MGLALDSRSRQHFFTSSLRRFEIPKAFTSHPLVMWDRWDRTSVGTEDSCSLNCNSGPKFCQQLTPSQGNAAGARAGFAFVRAKRLRDSLGLVLRGRWTVASPIQARQQLGPCRWPHWRNDSPQQLGGCFNISSSGQGGPLFIMVAAGADFISIMADGAKH